MELEWLQNWYSSRCNGDWEHSFGLRIETTDNPGWLIEIDVEGVKHKPFATVSIHRSEHDWLHCVVEQSIFKCACGPKNLSDALTVFKKWVESDESISNENCT